PVLADAGGLVGAGVEVEVSARAVTLPPVDVVGVVVDDLDGVGGGMIADVVEQVDSAGAVEVVVLDVEVVEVFDGDEAPDGLAVDVGVDADARTVADGETRVSDGAGDEVAGTADGRIL